MFPWSSSASNAALQGAVGSKALSLTSEQEKDIMTLNSSICDPKEYQKSTQLLQGVESSDIDDAEGGEAEKLALAPTDVNPKFSVLLNDACKLSSENTVSNMGAREAEGLGQFNSRPKSAQDHANAYATDATPVDSQNIVLRLVNGVNWDELEHLLGLVWVAARYGTGGDVATRRGQIVRLERQHVALSCKNLVEKLKMVMSYNNETTNPKHAAADLIAWILQEGVSLNFEAAALANDMLAFAQSSCMPVSRAGLRALRNLVVQSVAEYREVVLKHPHFINLFARTDAESYIYVCEMISHIAKSAQSEAACGEFFQTVCQVMINPVVGILALHDTWPKDTGVLRWTIVALITLRCPDLIQKFADELDKLDIIWKLISREESQGAHELAMELLAALVSSGDEQILARSLEHLGKLFDVLGVGNDFHLELNALRIARSIQETRRDMFGQEIGLDQLTKIQLLLKNGACEHQDLCLGIMLDLLAAGNALMLSPNGPDLVQPTIELLGSDSVLVQHRCVEVLQSMITENSEAVRGEAHSGPMLEHLIDLLQSTDFAGNNQLYNVVTWFAETRDEEVDLGQDVVHTLVANLTSEIVDRGVALPAVIAVLHGSMPSCEEAVKSGLLGYLTEALSEGSCDELEDITKALHCLLVNSDTAVGEVHANHPMLSQALVQHIKTVGNEWEGSDGDSLVSLLVDNLVAVLVTSAKRDDFATPECLQLLSNLLASGNKSQEQGAIQLLNASIEWFSLDDVESSKVLIPLCTLLPKYVDQSSGQDLAHSIMFVLGYMGQSNAALVACTILELGEDVANKAWEVALSMTDVDLSIHIGIMKVLHELRQQENHFFRNSSNHSAVVHLDHQNEALTEKCNELLSENQALVDMNKRLHQKVKEFSTENEQLHSTVARSSAQADMAMLMGNGAGENELRSENEALRGELARKQRCIEELERDKAILEEGAKVMREGMEQQHDWIETLRIAVEGTSDELQCSKF